MKTKNKVKKAKARVMWANYYPEIVSCSATRKQALGRSLNAAQPGGVRVAVIPLDDIEALVDLASQAITSSRVTGVWMGTQSAARAALAAIGIPLPMPRY